MSRLLRVAEVVRDDEPLDRFGGLFSTPTDVMLERRSCPTTTPSKEEEREAAARGLALPSDDATILDAIAASERSGCDVRSRQG